MNTAPQDDFSGDLARNLGGWSDDALMKELSRRTTMTTDADHELISTGAGIHLQHRDHPPITVTYTPASTVPGYWTIKIDGLRFATYDSPNLHEYVMANGKFSTAKFKFNNDLPTAVSIYIGYTFDYASYGIVQDENTSLFTPFVPLRFYIDWRGSTPTADFIATDDDSDSYGNPTSDFEQDYLNGKFQYFTNIYLLTTGEYVITGDAAKPAHVNFTPIVRGDQTFLDYWITGGNGLLTCVNLIDLEDAEPSALAPKTLTIPANTDDLVLFGRIRESVSPTLYLKGDGTVTPDEDYPLQVASIKTGSANELELLHPFTQRLHYRDSRAVGRTFMAKVQAKILDNKYYLDIYENGLYNSDGSARSSTSNDEIGFVGQYSTNTIPVDTVVYAIKTEDHYEFQHPVWL